MLKVVSSFGVFSGAVSLGSSATAHEVVCDGMDINQPWRLSEAERKECTVIQGDWFVRSDRDVDHDFLPNVKRIDGSLLFFGEGAVTIFNVPNLETISGKLRIKNNDKLESIMFPKLASVGNGQESDFSGGQIDILSNNSLKSLTLPKLAALRANDDSMEALRVEGNCLLETVEFPNLATIENIGLSDRLSICGNDNLHTVVLHRDLRNTERCVIELTKEPNVIKYEDAQGAFRVVVGKRSSNEQDESYLTPTNRQGQLRTGLLALDAAVIGHIDNML